MPAQKPVNVAMYAAGGAAAGLVVGAGAMKLSAGLRDVSCFRNL